MGFMYPSFLYFYQEADRHTKEHNDVTTRNNIWANVTNDVSKEMMGIMGATLKTADVNLQNFQKFLERHPQLSVDTQNIMKLLPAILELQAQKAAVYGRSYCRHGDLSIFLNAERKWDRISNIMEKAMKQGTERLYDEGTPTETFVDTVVDLASYSLLWVGYIMETHPKAFQKFLIANGLELSDPKSEEFVYPPSTT